MWIAIGVGGPVLVLAIAIALWPVLGGSMRQHERQHRLAASGRPTRREIRVRGDCALCAAQFDGRTPEEVTAAKNSHVLGAHARQDDAV